MISCLLKTVNATNSCGIIDINDKGTLMKTLILLGAICASPLPACNQLRPCSEAVDPEGWTVYEVRPGERGEIIRHKLGSGNDESFARARGIPGVAPSSVNADEVVVISSAVFDLGSATVKERIPLSGDVAGVAWSNDGDELAMAYWLQDEELRLLILDSTFNRVTDFMLRALDASRHRGTPMAISWAPGDDRVAVSVRSPASDEAYAVVYSVDGQFVAHANLSTLYFLGDTVGAAVVGNNQLTLVDMDETLSPKTIIGVAQGVAASDPRSGIFLVSEGSGTSLVLTPASTFRLRSLTGACSSEVASVSADGAGTFFSLSNSQYSLIRRK
jgi:hypothetical protein